MLDVSIPMLSALTKTHYSSDRKSARTALVFFTLLSSAATGCLRIETSDTRDASALQNNDGAIGPTSDVNIQTDDIGDASTGSDAAAVVVLESGTGDSQTSADSDTTIDSAADGSLEAAIDTSEDSDCAWNLIYPKLSHATLRAIWGSADNDIYAVGDQSTILHFDGQNWSVAPVDVGTDLLDIWGSAANDIYVVGGDNANYLSEIVTTGSISTKAVLLHYDGTAWREIDLGAMGLFTGVWGSGPNDVYVAATEGLFHYDGADWQLLSLPQGRKSISDIAGCGPDDVHAVNWGAQYYYYFDGDQWTVSQITVNETPVSSGYQQPGIWCSAPNDVWLISRTYGSSVLHWNGTSWRNLASETTEATNLRLHGFYETAEGNRYLSGADGVVLRFEQGEWNATLIDARGILYGIWTTNGDDIFLAGESGSLYKVNGSDVIDYNESLGARVVAFLDLGSEGFAVVNNRADLLLGTPDALRIERFSSSPRFFASTAIARPNGEILIGGGFCQASRSLMSNCTMQPGGQPAILRYDESGFSQIETIDVEISEAPLCDNISDFRQIGDDLLAVCYSGDILRQEGDAWRLISQQSTCALGLTYSEIWGSSANDLFVYGLRDVGPPRFWMYGYICHYDGLNWKEIPVSSIPNSLVAVWSSEGEPYALRQYAATETDDCRFSIERFDGSNWSSLASITEQSDQFEQWSLPGPDPGYFSHEACDLTVAYDGESWTILADKPDDTVFILGVDSSATEPYAATVQGGIYKRGCE